MYPIQFTDGTPVYNAEMWDPATLKFTVMAAAAKPRTYHSISLLLPDARVSTVAAALARPTPRAAHISSQRIRARIRVKVRSGSVLLYCKGDFNLEIKVGGRVRGLRRGRRDVRSSN